MVVIRLSRRGARKRPFYDVVVTDSAKRRDSGYLERVGQYNPRAQNEEVPLTLDFERIEYWLGQGGKPSQTVRNLMKRLRREQASASGPASKAKPKSASKAEAEPVEATSAEATSAESEPAEAAPEAEDTPESK